MSNSGYKIRNQYSTHFVTFTVVGWVDIFSRKECRDILINSLKYCIDNKGLLLYAYVIMSNHVHAIMAAEEKSKGLSAIIGDFKKFTSKQIINWILTSERESRRHWMIEIFRQYALQTYRNEQYQIWTHDNHPKEIVHPEFLLQKINYIHNNPVKAGIVRNADDYLYSSASNYSGCKDNLLEVIVLDLGSNTGLIY